MPPVNKQILKEFERHMNKNSFILYMDYKEDFDALTNEQRGILITAIFEYQETGTYNINDNIVKMAFLHIRRQLDRDSEKYEDIKAKRSAAGKKAMAKRWNNENTITNDNKNNKAITNDNKNNKAIFEITNITDNVNDNVNVTDNVINKKESKEKSKRFTPPTVQEVKEYCQERYNNVDAEAFIDFYTSKGWVIGKQSMKDWKAAVRTWEKRNNNISAGTSKKTNTGFNDFPQSKLDNELDEMEKLFIQEVNSK